MLTAVSIISEDLDETFTSKRGIKNNPIAIGKNANTNNKELNIIILNILIVDQILRSKNYLL